MHTHNFIYTPKVPSTPEGQFGVYHLQVYFVVHRLQDIVKAIPDHRWALPARQWPTGSQGPPWTAASWAGESGVPGLQPLLQALVGAEHLQAGLHVRVLGQLEVQLGVIQLGAELPQDSYEMAQGEAVVSHKP